MRRLRRALLLGGLLGSFGIASQAACDTGLAERRDRQVSPGRRDCQVAVVGGGGDTEAHGAEQHNNSD